MMARVSTVAPRPPTRPPRLHVDTLARCSENNVQVSVPSPTKTARAETFRARVDAAIARASRTDGVHPEAALGIGIAPRGANLIGAVNLLASGPRDAEGGHVARAKTNMVVAATRARVTEGARRFARNPPLARERLAATRTRALRCAPRLAVARPRLLRFLETVRQTGF